MAMVLTGQKPIQRARYGECSEGLPGSTKSVGCGARDVRERSARNLGDPGGSWTPQVSGASMQGKRMVCHRRGNLETKVGRTLNVEQPHWKDKAGRPSRPRRKRGNRLYWRLYATSGILV